MSEHIQNVLTENGEKVNGARMVTELNEFFCTKGERLAEKIPRYPPRSFDSLSTVTQAPRCSLIKETDAAEVVMLIAELDPAKAPGADGISNGFLKQHKETMAELISLLFNEVCVRGKTFPRPFKLAKIIPIPKAGSADKTVNGLRPISLLSAIAKILEKLIYRRIMDHFNATQFLFNQQYGFREKSSTTVACLETVNDLQKSCDLSKSPAVLSIDLSSAFDTVDHSILLSKYSYAGISDDFLDLLKSYLSDRQQFVQVGHWRSDSRAISIGTPQGSCLSTLNYLVYVNDIGNLRLNGKLRAFADDKIITYEDYAADLIQADCHRATHINQQPTNIARHPRTHTMCHSRQLSFFIVYEELGRIVPRV